MSLTGFTGEQIEIQETEIIRYEIPKKVYNFSIEGTENYYVGERGVLVHNDEGCLSGNEVKKKNTKVNKSGLEAGVNKGKVVNLII
jgi:anaerobic ribonucleoside-triphosphate reductase, putative, protein-containing